MKEKSYDEELEEIIREPRVRKRDRGNPFKDEDYIERRRKKSGKRFHRKPTHKDGFGEE